MFSFSMFHLSRKWIDKVTCQVFSSKTFSNLRLHDQLVHRKIAWEQVLQWEKKAKGRLKQQEKSASQDRGREGERVRLLLDLLRSPISFTFSFTSKLGPRLTEKRLSRPKQASQPNQIVQPNLRELQSTQITIILSKYVYKSVE